MSKSKKRKLPVPDDPTDYLHHRKFFDSEQDRCEGFGEYLQRGYSSGIFDKATFQVAAMAANADPDSCIRFSCLSILRHYLEHRDEIFKIYLAALRDFGLCGDLLICVYALNYLSELKPFSEFELNRVLEATIAHVKGPLQESQCTWSREYRIQSFLSFGELVSEEDRYEHWYRLLSCVVGEKGKDIARCLISLFPYGGVWQHANMVRYIIDHGDPAASRMMRVYLFPSEARYKQDMDPEHVRSSHEKHFENNEVPGDLVEKLVALATEMYSIIQGFTDEQRVQAELDAQDIDDLDEYFEGYLFL